MEFDGEQRETFRNILASFLLPDSLENLIYSRSSGVYKIVNKMLIILAVEHPQTLRLKNFQTFSLDHSYKIRVLQIFGKIPWGV